MEWTITPLCMGILEIKTKALQISLTGFSEHFDGPCIAWLLRSGQEVVIVDTGPADAEWGQKYHRGMRRDASQYLRPALTAHGIEPDSVRHVINTHLHWDHCWGNLDLPNAKIYVQREEMRYAAAPLPKDAVYYETQLGHLLMAKFYDRIVPVVGDMTLFPGIDLLLTPGHSPGSQCVAVNTANGIYIIAGDMVGLYEALDMHPIGLPGIYINAEDCYNSFDKMFRISKKILPGHDMAVMSQTF